LKQIERTFSTIIMGNKQLEPAIFTPNTGKRTEQFRQDEVVQIIPEFLN